MRDLFEKVSLVIQNGLCKLCEITTHHKFCELVEQTHRIDTDPLYYRPRYYYRCKFCGELFWNYGDREGEVQPNIKKM